MLTRKKPKLERFRWTHRQLGQDMTHCTWCGCPMWAGDICWENVETLDVFCSQRCAERMHADSICERAE